MFSFLILLYKLHGMLSITDKMTSGYTNLADPDRD